MQLHLDHYPSPLGEILLVSSSDGVLRALDFADYRARMERLLGVHYGGYELTRQASPDTLRAALDRYFSGDLCALAGLAIGTGGSAFQREVWRHLREISAGSTTSYGALAASMGRPSAARAVGTANGQNPIAIVVPCHRVIGAQGSLVGYAGGVERKRWLLAHEAGACLAQGREVMCR